MLVYLQERADTGVTRRIPATHTHALLNQPATQQLLASQLYVTALVPWVGLTRDQLQAYLDSLAPGE